MTLWEAKDKIEKGEAGEFGDIPVAYERLSQYFHLLACEIKNTSWPLGYRTKAVELGERALNLGNRFQKKEL